MQLSAVCLKFAEAASLVPSLRCGLDFMLWSNQCAQRAQLDSRLLLCWAEHLQAVHLDAQSCSIPGVRTFIAAATGVTDVRTSSGSLLEALQIEDLLSHGKGVTSLDMTGTPLPALLPPTITQLVISILSDSGPEAAWSEGEPSACVYRAGRLLPLLQKLTLCLFNMSRIVLTCPIVLARLRHLSIIFTATEETRLDLGWVQQQSCTQLHILIQLQVSSTAQHRAMVDQLSRLKVTILTLHIYAAFPEATQQLWYSLSPARWVLWLVFDTDFNSSFSSASHPLQALPHCGRIDIKSYRPIFITWSALTAHSAHITLFAHKSSAVHVLGAGTGAPDSLQQPWQLQIAEASSVHGLPASQPTKGRYFLQNAAARAAGWTDAQEAG